MVPQTQSRRSRGRPLSGAWFACALTLMYAGLEYAGANAVPVPAPRLDNPKVAGNAQTAVLAGGCFWGMQAVFEHVKGVRRVLAGYSGGSGATAHYGQVGTEGTGHAGEAQ